MLTLKILAILVGAFILWKVVRFLLAIFLPRRQAVPNGGRRMRPPIDDPDGPHRIPDKPRSFGIKTVWITVKSDDGQAVASAAGITDTFPCNWEYGIRWAYEGHLFISPPVDGWVFLIGSGLPDGDTEASIDELEILLNQLSARFGEAYFFASHRTVGFFAWMRSVNGSMERTYSYVDGANVVVRGEPTSIERSYNFYNSFSEEARDPEYAQRKDVTHPFEDDVLAIARVWCIDPQELETKKDLHTGLGLLSR